LGGADSFAYSGIRGWRDLLPVGVDVPQPLDAGGEVIVGGGGINGVGFGEFDVGFAKGEEAAREVGVLFLFDFDFVSLFMVVVDHCCCFVIGEDGFWIAEAETATALFAARGERRGRYFESGMLTRMRDTVLAYDDGAVRKAGGNMVGELPGPNRRERRICFQVDRWLIRNFR
jgi:hypothetical protein